MRPHTWRWSFFRIATLTILAIALCAWHWRSELSWSPAKPVILRPFPMWHTGWNPEQISAATMRLLNRQLPPGCICKPTLGAAEQQLRSAGAPVFINWKAIAPVGITRDTTVSLNVGGQRAGEAISRLLISLDPSQSNLAFTVDEAVITISTNEDFDANVVTRVHDVRDLLPKVPAFTGATTYRLDQAGGGGRDVRSRAEAVDIIIQRIKESITPKSWNDHGGKFASIRELAGQLIITQTAENHKLIEHGLAWLRWRNQTLATTRKASWIVVPMFLGTVLLELLLVRFRRRLAHRADLCRACGYDLRASPERCPECGTARAVSEAFVAPA